MKAADLMEYKRRYDSHLQTIAANLEAHLKKLLADCKHIDRVSARAKSPDRFEMKAKKLSKDGKPKYSAPLMELQDQIGARIIVFYKADVSVVSDVLDKYIRHIEIQELQPDSEWEFGYFGKHYIKALPTDVVPGDVSNTEAPRFFELQIKTLFQHAWSEANHDLCYKPNQVLTGDQTRRFAYTAAQAWGADQVFEELRSELL